MAAASGDVMAFPDDDCWYSPHLLHEVKRLLCDQSRIRFAQRRGPRREWDARAETGGVRERCDLGTANLFRTSVGMALFVRRDRIRGEFKFDESLGVGAGTSGLPRARILTTSSDSWKPV